MEIKSWQLGHPSCRDVCVCVCDCVLLLWIKVYFAQSVFCCLGIHTVWLHTATWTAANKLEKWTFKLTSDKCGKATTGYCLQQIAKYILTFQNSKTWNNPRGFTDLLCACAHVNVCKFTSCTGVTFSRFIRGHLISRQIKLPQTTYFQFNWTQTSNLINFRCSTGASRESVCHPGFWLA